MSKPEAVFSAPGKALIAGGYLVLFPEYSAFSVSLSTRIHAAAYPPPSLTSLSKSSNTTNNDLQIESPQFDSEWHYPSGEGTHRNPYLEACYDVVSQYFDAPPKGRIVIWSDSSFHSQNNAKQDHFPTSLSKFSYHGCPITEVPKTGLGSSAALVTSITRAMVYLCTGTQNFDLMKIHNLAQIAHCNAQQKVGSGFDVATAVYGPLVYSRFQADRIPSTQTKESIQAAVNSNWGVKITPCTLPSHIAIIMGDVSIGSETPGMVKQVLQWRNNNQSRANELFTQLNAANMSLVKALTEDDNNVSLAIQSVRKYLQQLTTESGVPIEPPTQTNLLNKASQFEGVLGGIVPGAGGNDAICLLADVNKRSADLIRKDLETINEVNWLPLNLETVGLKSEDPNLYLY